MGNNKLREIRTNLGMSQLQLSFLSRVPNCVISDFERGYRKPWPKAKKLLAEALHRPVNEIFPDNGNMEP
jgi:transcriptional regulator with XRE-family HTH domain